MTKVLGLALVGAAAAAGLQPLTPAGWWLDSGRGVAVVTTMLAALAAAIASRSMAWPLRRGDAAAALAFWAGANVGMAAVLFSAGPGNLFPIVLAIGAAISAAAVVAGSAIGLLLAAAARRTSG
jgi:hypothetical protein